MSIEARTTEGRTPIPPISCEEIGGIGVYSSRAFGSIAICTPKGVREVAPLLGISRSHAGVLKNRDAPATGSLPGLTWVRFAFYHSFLFAMSLEYILDDYPKKIQIKGGLPCEGRPLEPADEISFHEFFLALPTHERMFIKHRVTEPEVIRDWCQNI